MFKKTAPESSEIRSHFLADHQRLDALLARLIAAFEANDREDIQELWTEFETGLLVHLDAEEETLIPALARVDASEAKALLAEHARFRVQLVELGAGIDLHTVRLETAREFARQLLDHARREDEHLYRWSDLNLAETDRATVIAGLARMVHRTVGELLKARKSSGK